MKFNDHELSLFAAARLGKADKEGCLWMREVEGKIRKKQSESSQLSGWSAGVCVLRFTGVCGSGYVQRWFLLSGNLLFYCKTEMPVMTHARICF